MNEAYLRVFSNKSELVLPDGITQVFFEGKMNLEAKYRYSKIVTELSKGYLKAHIIRCTNQFYPFDFSNLESIHLNLLNKLVHSVTSEVGRALVGLTILQLCVKAIEPMQSIRLHKGSSNSRDFSWQDGISMRSLDKNYITPVLRQYDLLRLNADGFMMTRSLAENYPYSPVYKANLRGARGEWLNLIELIERNEINPELALHYILSQLLNKATSFKNLADQSLIILCSYLTTNLNLNRFRVFDLIQNHIKNSDYAARIMEIGMHSLIQAFSDLKILTMQELKPLSQMRSANKKHKNIGDVEIIEDGYIVEAWDAKYGKAYLRDELEELTEKLTIHPNIILVGLVTSITPERQDEIESRCIEIEVLFGIVLTKLTFEEWIEYQFKRALETNLVTEKELAQGWLIAYTESIAQKRRDIAPIDEPCYQWLLKLKEILELGL